MLLSPADVYIVKGDVLANDCTNKNIIELILSTGNEIVEYNIVVEKRSFISRKIYLV